jgi:hypothetical protein
MNTRAPKISDDYLAQQRQLHENPDYGFASVNYAPMIKDLVQRVRAKSISDYGAGKKHLLKALNDLGVSDFAYFPYDPAFPEYGDPVAADLVVCIDVLEHIEPEYLDGVLRELATLVQRFGFFSIHTGAAKKLLPDGRNAHLIQEPMAWWLPRLFEHFELWQLLRSQNGFWVVVGRKDSAAFQPQ